MSSSKSKKEIIKRIAEKLGIKPKGADDIMSAIADELHQLLLEDGVVKIPHLGVLMKVVDKPALPPRQVRSPKTGELIDAPAKEAYSVIKARATKELKNLSK